jgi:hypothetical protein
MYVKFATGVCPFLNLIFLLALIPLYTSYSDDEKISDHEPGAVPARIPTPRTEYVKFTGDPAEVATRERRRKLP